MPSRRKPSHSTPLDKRTIQERIQDKFADRLPEARRRCLICGRYIVDHCNYGLLPLTLSGDPCPYYSVSALPLLLDHTDLRLHPDRPENHIPHPVPTDHAPDDGPNAVDPGQ